MNCYTELMVKRTHFIISVVFFLFLLFFAYKYFLPYGVLDKNSELCRRPELFHNQLKCRLSGCAWGSGDLTGPPFCGAYK
jgi:hypothetical protein